MNLRKHSTRESGFTLVEIAIVLVIIGLLLGGILKGQELINSARVRNLADMNAGIQAAYYGFIDRYRRVPGDWNSVAAEAAIGLAITGGGNDNGRIDTDGQGIMTVWQEPNALWEQLSKAGFIQGAYDGSSDPPGANSNHTPLNAFNQNVVLARTGDFIDIADASPLPRLHLILGRGVPVDIARELDIKVDDGVPDTGVLRLTIAEGAGATFGFHGESSPECIIGEAGSRIYDIARDSQDCNTVFLY